MTGVFTDDFNTERDAPFGITWLDEAAGRGVLGRAISSQGRATLNHVLHANAWFQSRHAEPAGFRPGFNWRPQVDLERSWRIWIPTDARWSPPGTRRMEPRASRGAGFGRTHRWPESCGAAV